MDSAYYPKAQFQSLRKSLSGVIEPLNVFKALSHELDESYLQLLESSEAGQNGEQQSLLLLSHCLKISARRFNVSIEALNENGKAALKLLSPALEFVTNSNDTLIELEYPDQRVLADEAQRLSRKTTLDAMRQVLKVLSNEQSELADQLVLAGVAGFDIMESIESLPEVNEQAHDFPDYLFLLADQQLVINQQTFRNELRSLVFKGDDESERLDATRQSMHRLISIIEKYQEAEQQPLVRTNADQAFIQTVTVMPDEETFGQQVEEVQKAIRKGRVFQTVISRDFCVDCPDPLLAYAHLRQQNPSPYQFYLKLGEFVLFGASPESSLRYEHQSRRIQLMPIAGTRGRGRDIHGNIDHEQDARLEVELKLDEKELAEHMMLVDLARNDLARIGTPGSRRVTELMGIYRYSAVMHMVSRVESELAPELDIFDACAACFHMGTLTGAPKVEAMILIRELEQRRRGTYGGAVGYFNGAGDMDSAIVIRSALVRDGIARVSAGAGVVADSTAEMETQETINKAASVLNAIASAQAEIEMGACHG